MNISGTLSSIEHNLDKVGMYMGFTHDQGGIQNTLECLWNRTNEEFHVPDLATVKYFATTGETAKPLKDGVMLWVLGEILKGFGFLKRIGTGASNVGKGMVIGGLAWILAVSTYYRSASPPTVPSRRGSGGGSGGLIPNGAV